MPVVEHLAQFPVNLRTRRRQVGLTQAELATRSGLNQRYISALENGRWPRTREHVRRLARGLRVRVSDLLVRPPAPTGVNDHAR